MKATTFNLRLWFAVGSFGTIVLISAVSAILISQYLTESLLTRENQISQEFMQNIVSVDGPTAFKDDGSQPYLPKPALLDFTKHILSMPGVMRVNIYAATRKVLWSTEKALIGNISLQNEELESAFGGERITELGTLPSTDKPEHMSLGNEGQFIEAYIPIRESNGVGPIIGVVELYKRPNALQNILERGDLLIWFGAMAGAALLFGMLYWIVQRGARIIEKQQSHMGQMEVFAAIGQMSSAVAHSLRNPMSAIRSSAELWRTELPAGEQDIADEVIREIDRMDSYVRDLLAYTRSEAYQLQPTDPKSVMDAVLEKLQRPMAANKISLTQMDRRESRKLVSADAMLLEQALTSVVTNAIEAMPAGGRLGIAIGPMADTDRMRIVIADNGPGIPPEIIGKVSESYFTTKVRGLGLGLVLARGIIEQFGGQLALISKRESGTRVFVDLRFSA